MKFLRKWMCSSAHLKLFGFVARIGLPFWLFLPAAVILAPWYCWADAHAYANETFGYGALVLSVPITILGLTGFQRVSQTGSRLTLQVELRRGLLGLHVSKQMPTRADLRTTVLQSVAIARQMGMRSIRIESPLLVDNLRRARLIAVLQQALAAQGPGAATLQVIAPKPMMWLRSVVFTAMRKLRRYDGKHLPATKWFRTSTAGILLVL